MQQITGTVQSYTGQNVKYSVSIGVYTDSGLTTLATIYSDNTGTVAPNPFNTNENGVYSFYATAGTLYFAVLNPDDSINYSLQDITVADVGGGSLLTCDASSVPLFTEATCEVDITTAQLINFDGTSATAIDAIGAAGVGRIPIPLVYQAYANYIFGTHPFTGDSSISGIYTGIPGSVFGISYAFDASSTSDLVVWGLSPIAESFSGNATDNLGIQIFLSNAISNPLTGVVTASTLDSGGDATSTPVSTLDSGGLSYVVADTVSLACGAQYTVNTVDGVTGAITSLVLTNTGASTGCIVGVGQATTGGTGTGATISVSSVNGGWHVNDTFKDDATSTLTGHVTAVSGTGLITAYVIDNGGSGLSVSTNNTIDNTTVDSSFNTASLNYTATGSSNGDGTMKVFIPYKVYPIA